MIARPNSPGARITAALDTTDPVRAEAWASALAGRVGLFKVGLELFCAAGPGIVGRIAARAPVFLDLKFHDIPNTVAGAVRAVVPLRPAMLTVHAAGGPEMIAAARREAELAGAERPAILAVTVLTSMDVPTLSAIGISGGPVQQVLRLARMALDSGADGLVCSPREVAPLRDAFGAGPMLVVPGVRPAGSARGDQSRIATPAEAIGAGADWIVVGRPITQSEDPAAMADAIADGMGL
jgi:orotidine-5'-phosphate decarboxylase